MPTSADAAESGSETESESEAEASESDDSECVSLVEQEVAADAYAKGLTLLEESRDGEHYVGSTFEQAMGSLLNAATQGHRAAQSLYGRTLFGVMFMAQAPTEQEREDYISCFMFLRIAALRGDAEAQNHLPGMTDATPPSTMEPPLDQIPADWLVEAFSRADAWMDCHGDTVGDRGAEPPPTEPQ